MKASNSGQANVGGSSSSGVLILDAPEVIRLLPGNVLPALYNNTDLEVRINSEWPIRPPGMRQFVVFVWRVVDESPIEVTESIIEVLDTTPFPIDAFIPASYLLSSAVVELSFHVHNLSPDNPTFEPSESVTFTIDRDFPGSGLLQPAIYPADPITSPYLISNPFVQMNIPETYSGRAANDQVLLYFSGINVPPTGPPTLISPPISSATGLINVLVPADVFRSFPGALLIFCFYRLRDYVGNLNPQFSQVAQATLDLAGPPVRFVRPRFPQAELHSAYYITCSSNPPMWTSVEVRIDPDPAFSHGDLLTMRFQGYASAPDQNPIADTALTLTHFWDAVADAAGYSFKILDVERVIRPLKDTAGGRACFVVSRGATTLGISAFRYARFDRVVITTQPPTLYCWIGGNAPEP
ncbi:hypothetical protein [Edaphovirga cremea]|uniref:hypothetical protein n=1 Tax=Edaphovirga cremea TaxID=2267246 RepID=UPI003989A031